MQHLDNLWKIVNVASSVRDMAVERKTLRYTVEPPVTLYLHLQSAHITFEQWTQPIIEISSELQASFGWRLKADQDEYGVYFVAKRMAVVGNLAQAKIRALVPPQTNLVLRLEKCSLTMSNLSGTVELPSNGGLVHLLSSG
ncbi:MAG: hypothetical protein KC615_08090 [Anaerolineae bacterium]|nr:hypothetical protein [Anaerolineae bacterium]MCA9892930.1 hypothetical protein [Anaerolineae bacterium]